MKLSVLAILVTAMAAAALPAEKPNKETSASLSPAAFEHEDNVERYFMNTKRAHQAPGPCLSDVSCQGGTCKNRVCVYDVKREVQDISKDPSCHNDVDCEGGSCLNGICTADPPAKRDTEYTKREVEDISKDPSCHNDADCEGGSCLNGICTADPPAKRDGEK